MSTDRHCPPQPALRSRLIGSVAWLRARPWGVFLSGLLIGLTLLVPAHVGDWHDSYVGVPAAIASLVVVAGALVGGPTVGAGLAVTIGVAFDALIITDRWLVAGVASAAVIIVWLGVGIAAGMLGDRYRRQVRTSLAQASEAREAVERVLDSTPSLHASAGLAGVAHAVCRAALETTGCAAAALVTIEGDDLRLVAREPGPNGDSPLLSLDALPDVREELVSQLKPSFVRDLAGRPGRSVLVDVAGFRGLVSSLRVPVALEQRAVAVLALGWATEVPEPEPAWLATVQRFADHAAVALEKERRVEAQRDAARLYRRFEASLIPRLGTGIEDIRVGVRYSPGERRMRLGGDFVDLITAADGAIRAVIGDVAGHGPDAAAVGAHLRAAWRALAHRHLGAAEIMGTLNQLIMEESDRGEAEEDHMPLIATVCTVDLSADRSSATFLSAGHPPALLLCDGEVTTMPLGGLPLGVESSEWQPASVSLPSDWVLLLYTDGIIEARVDPTSQARIGIEGLIALLTASPGKAAPTSVDRGRLMAEVESMNGGPLADDATLLAFSRGDSERAAL